MRDIDSLMERGEVIFKFPIRAHYLLRQDENGSRMMVSVPKRNFKRAVKRNLLKRRIREAFRLNSAGAPAADILFTYVGKEVEDYERIAASVTAILSGVAQKTQEDCGVSSDTSC